MTPLSVHAPPAVSPVSLATQSRDLRSGRLTPLSAVEEALARVDEFEPAVRALLPEPGRRERLVAEAEALERRYPSPEGRPPLYGALVGVKDIFAADGFETRGGSRLPPELFAMAEGPVVSSLRRAGALVLGKTVTTEFAYFAPGPTANPWATDRTPGGSSSGSAAAVAAGYCALALGTQTIGSISRPAAYCGIAGWKPSYDRTSREGVIPFSPSLDHVGFLAADAASLRVAAPVACPGWDEERAAAAAEAYCRRKPILAVPDGPYLAQADEAARFAFERGVKQLQGRGFSVIRVPVLEDIDDINARHRRIASAELERTHRAWFASYGRLYADATAEYIRMGAALGANELELDRVGRLSLRAVLEAALDEAGADYWLSPSSTGQASLGLDSTGSPLMNLPWTHAGLPTLALPAALSPDGLPLGLQLAAPFGCDEELLALGAALDGVLG